MQYGLGHLSIVPIRLAKDTTAEMVSQLLYGDHFKIKEERKYWSRIQVVFDGFEGWVQNNQITKITEEDFLKISSEKQPILNPDFLIYATKNLNELIPIVLGSRVDIAPMLNHSLEVGPNQIMPSTKSHLIPSALLYLNAPYLSGGRTPFGIDASGLTQMVYKINGHRLRRTTTEQATQGDALSFIEESEPGDLAFFDNSEGTIDHVGIILKDNHIIHADGLVRIDRLDHTGIFNTEKRKYSHSLRVIKKLI